MNESLKVIVADDEPLLVDEISMYLREAGHEVIATANNGQVLVEKTASLKPDLVVTDIKMPEMDGLEAAKAINVNRPVPVVIVSAYHDDEFINRAKEQCVMSYLVKPINENNLKSAVSLAVCRFKEFESLFAENDNLRRTIDERKIIERAKGVLMKRTGIDEETAFKQLQLQSREKAVRMVDFAKDLLAEENA